MDEMAGYSNAFGYGKEYVDRGWQEKESALLCRYIKRKPI